jgi:predicted RNase H-like HicB family nuclease
MTGDDRWAKYVMELRRREFYTAETVAHAKRAATTRAELQGLRNIAIEADDLDGGYVAEVLEVPGAVGQGDTDCEAAQNAVDATLAILDARQADAARKAVGAWKLSEEEFARWIERVRQVRLFLDESDDG